MKKNYFLSALFAILSFSAHGQGTVCANATMMCISSNTFTFPSPTGVSNMNSISCLATTPNPAWFNIQTGTGGDLTFLISQTNTAGAIVDVDFIVWGPFASPTCSATELVNTNVVACSYSVAGIETFTLPATFPGMYYKLLITNFSMQAGSISLTQTNYGQPGAGSITCDIICPVVVVGGGVFCQGVPATLTATIANATSYQWSSSVSGPIPGNTQSITVTQPAVYTVTVTKPGCFVNSASATYVLAATPNIGIPNTLTNCAPNVTFNLAQNTPVIQNGNTDAFVDYHTTFVSSIDGSVGPDLILNPFSYNAPGPFPQTIYVSYEDNNACIYQTSFELHVSTTGAPALSVTIENNTVTVTAVGTGIYQYSLNNGSFQQSPVFENVPLGTHTVTVVSANNCGSGTISFDIVTPLAPDAVSPQYFSPGATLSNVVVMGQNVQWYDGPTNRNALQTTSLLLPLTTPLVNNTIYYASQTVNGVESVNRTAVLALLMLSNNEVLFPDLTYYPNPVKNNFTITNSSVIDNVSVFSLLGQKIMDIKEYGLQVDIDMSNFSKGVYFLKIHSNGNEKTIKVIKE